jgi:hypothetical protein
MSISFPPSKGAKNKKFSCKRTELRESFWPGSDRLIWSRQKCDGFATVPRTLPLILRLIKELCPKGDPSRVYVDLWSRVHDEGFVDVTDTEEFAYSAGYSGTRAVRTWREHVQSLVDLGFIMTKERGARDVRYVLILNPYHVVAKMRKDSKVPEEWWVAFVAQAQAIGADISCSSAAEGQSRSA